ncbi:MAG TPA: ABC transporter ATP-binding protein [Pseudobacteroides sp.]|uniref:ABC transporter ATP-binding protein n=1 Tax=Pseudobacteroides sp. TaxID=1968840 RepID=UPI002F934308
MKNSLTITGLTKKYDTKTAVNGFSAIVEKGEFFGLLGANGAGKTTTIECILGIKKMDAGTVEILGYNPVSDRKKLFQKVGVQFQQTNYQDKITVKEACQVAYSLYENAKDWNDLLKLFGLFDMQNRMVNDLSGGERQRLSVLLALIPNPELVFLDELTTGLDSKARRDIWKHLEQLKKRGLTIVLTSHYMDEVQTLCDRICILKHGNIVVMDTVPNVIKNSPCDNLEDAYLWYTDEEVNYNESF